MKATLTFDIDDVTDMVEFKKFAKKDKFFDTENVIDLRHEQPEECRGRLTGDRGRLQVGLQVGRLFGVKSGRKAGDWIPIEAFFKDSNLI